jgi:SAM-dependent methyltransferase
VVDFSKQHFQVNAYLGPIEEQSIESSSLDLILMFDVFEHFHNPVSTLDKVLALLKPNGKIIIQTPDFQTKYSFFELQDANHKFLEQLKSKEHVFLFSKVSIKAILNQMGVKHVEFLPPLFPYDSFLVASRNKLSENSKSDIEHALGKEARGRFAQALLDLDKKRGELQEQLDKSLAERSTHLEVIRSLDGKMKDVELDREKRLEIIQILERQNKEIESDRTKRLETIHTLEVELRTSEKDRMARLESLNILDAKVREIEADRTARLELIEELSRKLDQAETDRSARLSLIQKLEHKLDEVEVDRSARLNLIRELEKQLAEVEADRAARLELITNLEGQLAELEEDRSARLEAIRKLEALIHEIEADRAARLETIQKLDQQLKVSEADRSSRLDVIQSQQSQITELERDKEYFQYNLEEKNAVIKNQVKQLEALENELAWGPIRFFRSIRNRWFKRAEEK